MSVLPQGFTITAHTGAMCTRRNSLRSVKKAADRRCDITEMDVTFRPDGTVVIIQMEKPAQTDGVLFEDALKLVAQSPSIKVNLDLKAFWNTAAVQEAVRRHGLLERVFYTGVYLGNAEQVRTGSPGIPYYINERIGNDKLDNREYIEQVARNITGAGGIGLNSDFRGINALVVELMHKNGLLVSAWTVNKKKDQLRMLELGVDNITTTSPLKLMRLVTRHEALNNK